MNKIVFVGSFCKQAMQAAVVNKTIDVIGWLAWNKWRDWMIDMKRVTWLDDWHETRDVIGE